MDLDFGIRTRVLFVDDEPNVLKSLQRLFRSKSWEIFFASSVSEALKLLKAKNGVDVVVTDQRMPDNTGAELLREIRILYPWCARIVLSGYTDLPSVLAVINEGSAQRFLSKPWEDKVLLDVVSEAAESVEIRRQNQYFRAIVQDQNIEMKVSGYLMSKQIDQVDKSRIADLAIASLEALPLGIVAVNKSNVVELVNQEAASMFSLGIENSLIGRNWNSKMLLTCENMAAHQAKDIKTKNWSGTVYILWPQG